MGFLGTYIAFIENQEPYRGRVGMTTIRLPRASDEIENGENDANFHQEMTAALRNRSRPSTAALMDKRWGFKK